MRLAVAALLVAFVVAPVMAKAATPFPPFLEMRVAFEPTAFPSLGTTHLLYELLVTNFDHKPRELRRVEILDAESGKARAAFEGQELDKMLQSVGGVSSQGRQLPPGGSVIVFLSLHGTVPERVRHRLTIGDESAEGAETGTHHTRLRTLAPPVRGEGWVAADGPNNDEDNHHRRGILALGGRLSDSRRFAIDWKQVRNGEAYSGDARDRGAYYCYGQDVFAVADARVVQVVDNIPENVPGRPFRPAVPITLDTVGGNSVLLDVGDGQFVSYSHLQPGSLTVKAGERVRRGHILARIGVSGDAREPHLHLAVTDSPDSVRGEGLPYVIDAYRIRNEAGDLPAMRRNELPMRNMIVDFGGKSEGR